MDDALVLGVGHVHISVGVHEYALRIRESLIRAVIDRNRVKFLIELDHALVSGIHNVDHVIVVNEQILGLFERQVLILDTAQIVYRLRNHITFRNGLAIVVISRNIAAGSGCDGRRARRPGAEHHQQGQKQHRNTF